MSPLGGGATGVIALDEYGEACRPDRSEIEWMSGRSATISLPGGREPDAQEIDCA